MFILYLAGIGFFSFLLIKATDILMDGLHDLTANTHVNAFGITAFFLALATSFPEFFVAITAAVRGNPEISLGNVIGSNIANISLVLGGAAVISGSVKAYDDFLSGEVFHTFLAGSLPLLLLMDGNLDRLDGILLLVVYVLYNMTVLSDRRDVIKDKEKDRVVWWRKFWSVLSNRNIERAAGKMVIGVALLIFSADMLVRIAEMVAAALHLPMVLVGLFVVAIGTSLPELSFEIVALKNKESEMALGNILGSVVANSTLVLGTTVMFAPIVLENGLRPYLIATLGFIFIFLFFWIFVKSKKKLERWEGAVLVFLYLVFILAEFIKLSNGSPMV